MHLGQEYIYRLPIVILTAVLSMVVAITPAASDVLDEVLDETDPTAPPPPPPEPGTPGAGQVNVQLLRVAPPAYADGISALAGPNRRSPREISNIVLSQSGSILSEKLASDMIWQWGQFVDHDLDLTGTDPAEPAPIDVPSNDAFFDPNRDIPFDRSVFDPTTGSDTSNPRQQINNITAFQDASNVYGSDATRQRALRTLDGTGRLKTSVGNLLPFNEDGLPNAPDTSARFFLAGDVRSNEQVALTAMHTLWVREHNTIADRLRQRNSSLTGDQIYNTARLIVMAEQQSITYNQWLPILLGDNALPAHNGYRPSVNPNISNVFSTAAFRLGHTMLSPFIRRLDGNGRSIPQGDLALRDAFFAPERITQEGGIDPLLRGLSSQIMQRVDSKIVDDVRNFLFGPPPSVGLDLGSLNMQRGRDHGLPDYNEFRIAFGLVPVSSFSDISSDPAVQAALDVAYFGNVNDIDPWVGMISEDHVSSNTLIGPLIHAALVDQFTRLRDGNPQWYQNLFSSRAQRSIEKNTLFEVIVRNTGIKKPELPKNVFVAQ